MCGLAACYFRKILVKVVTLCEVVPNK